MCRLDADRVWWLFENVVTHCALVCYFGRFLFPPCLFSPQNVQNTLYSGGCEAPAEVMTLSWKGFLLAAHLRHSYTTHQCAATLRFNQSNSQSPEGVLYVYILYVRGHFVLCCVICMKHLYVMHLKVPCHCVMFCFYVSQCPQFALHISTTSERWTWVDLPTFMKWERAGWQIPCMCKPTWIDSYSEKIFFCVLMWKLLKRKTFTMKRWFVCLLCDSCRLGTLLQCSSCLGITAVSFCYSMTVIRLHHLSADFHNSKDMMDLFIDLVHLFIRSLTVFHLVSLLRVEAGDSLCFAFFCQQIPWKDQNQKWIDLNKYFLCGQSLICCNILFIENKKD